jgi:hypothetical protein
MANGWTLERQQRQSKLIRQWKPWEKSTGAKTKLGKEISSKNAYKGSTRIALRAITKALNENKLQLRELDYL